jgi:Tfp pilus assembly PilM family ATPase
MSRAFTVQQLPTPLKEPETQLQFLITWDATRPIPYDAETLIQDAMQLARARLEISRANQRAARPERRA